ncbi:MAG: P-II family nitrogen regulator [Limnochordia bacterium]|nr:P-II family nitrogen regulator [Limnochordia bacterium]MDD2628913.1 P-II family nitrogen regulator [Limnochordia bacterium]
MHYDVIMAILRRGTADAVMEAAKKAGAQGGTILLARGTGAQEAKTFFGITVETSREILMILSRDSQTDQILQAIIREGQLDKPGAGIAFVLDAKKIVGLEHRQGIVDCEEQK